MARGKGGRGKGGGSKLTTIDQEEIVKSQIPQDKELGPVKDNATVVPAWKGQKKSSGRKRNDWALSIPLREKENLTREDVKCPICWSMLMRPTTLPCNHSMCVSCFEKHIEENTLCCPCCRRRIAVWVRNAKTEEKLVDERLWKRLELEFPQLVQARMLNMDTENVLDADPLAQLPDPESYSEKSASPTLLDGTLTEPGEVKEEYDLLYQQHRKDLELERLREEAASESFIQQLEEEENERVSQERARMEEEDRKLAEKIQEDFKASQISSSSLSVKAKTPQRNLMEEWIANKSFTSNTSVSPDIVQTPKSRTMNLHTSKLKRPNSKTSSSSSSKKVNKKGKRPTSLSSTKKSNVSRASQDMMANFLMSQNSQLLQNEADESFDIFDGCEPCSSRSIPKRELQFSVVSPTKSLNGYNDAVPSTDTLVVPVSSCLEDLTSRKSLPEEPVVFSSLTRETIQREVDNLDKPVQSVPRTPPHRRLGGTFFPEPNLLMTASKVPTPSNVSAYILSPSKQACSILQDASMPSSATDEKRICNHSVRPSLSPNEAILHSPGKCDTMAKSLELQLSQSERCSSDEYGVTTEDVNSKKRVYDEKQQTMEGSPYKKAKIGIDPQPLAYDEPVVKIEPQPYERFEVVCSQGVIIIDNEDEDFIQNEAQELERLKMKKEQEEADLAFALKLQNDLRAQGGSNISSREKENYSLRNWINRTPGPSSSSSSSSSKLRPTKTGRKSTKK